MNRQTIKKMKTHEELMLRSEELAKNPIPTRQLCKRCMKYSGLAFRIPDETWMAVTDDRYQHLCLPCFVDMADERLIDWEPGLLIYGESMAHLRERQQRVARGEYTDEGLSEWGNRSKITESLTELVHLHACEQEGLQSGKPTPEQWFNAVNKAHDALWPKSTDKP